MNSSASAVQIPPTHRNSVPLNAGSTKQDGFKVTPALKAARTRAWKTLEQFSQAEAEELFPSNAFVAFKISSLKLKQAGIPTIKTKWEDGTTKTSAGAGKISSVEVLSKTRDGNAKKTPTQDSRYEEGNGNVKIYDVKNIMEVPRNTNTLCEETAEKARTLNGQSCGLRESGHTNSAPITGAEVTSCVTSQLSSTPSQTAATRIPLVSTLQSALEVKPQLNYTDTGATLIDFVTTNSAKNFLLRETNYPSKSEVFQTPKEIELYSGVNYNSTESSPTLATKRKRQNEVLSTNPGGILDSKQNEDINKRTKIDLEPNSLAEISVRQISPSKSFKIAVVTSSKHFQASSSNTHSRIGQTASVQKSFEDPSYPNFPYLKDPMAPVRDPNSVDASLKDAIQKLYDVQLQVHGFVPETQPLLIDKMAELAHSLAHLQTLTSPILSPNNPIHKNRIAPEVIDYVDDSRNPDIYNREFVELVQRGNAVMNGKQQAFRDFSEVFADALKNGMPELSDQIDRVMDNIKSPGQMSNSGQISSGAANGTVKTERKNDGPGKADTGANGASKA